MHVPTKARRPRPGTADSRVEVVERAEAYLRAHIDSTVLIGDVCRAVGRSERSLRDAFYEVRGMPPKRCLLHQRLNGVRRVLQGAGRRHTTVADAAAGYGLFELGRFAGKYKQMFGEAPSQTLRSNHPEADAWTHEASERSC